MYLKHLKYFQLVFGLVLVCFFIAAPTVMPALDPDAYPVMPAIAYFTGSIPSLLIVLAAGSVNLMSGCYMAISSGGRRTLQGLASLSAISAGMFSSLSTLGFLHASPFAENLPFVSVALLASALVLHALCNLHQLNFGGGGRSSSYIPTDSGDSSRENGTVKWFNVSKGFGFITRDNGGDIFVHYRAIRGEGHRTLGEGQRVEFLVADKEKGLQAEDVIAARQ